MAVATTAINVRERTVNGLHPPARNLIRTADTIGARWAAIRAAKPGERSALLNQLGRDIKTLGLAVEAFIPMDEEGR